MKGFRKIFYKQENRILTVLFLSILCGLVAFRYDYYYDLNDDVLMKDILAGVYTGTPESRNIQMLYLVSAFISFFYRMMPDAPWYGLFLCICQYGSIGLIVNRSLRFCRTVPAKVWLLLIEGAVIAGAMLEHLVFVQYTVTCTMLAAAAAFLFLTSDIPDDKDISVDKQMDSKAFFRKNIPSMVLVFAAFLVRSEMLALVLPLICMAGIWKWSFEYPVFTKNNFVRYLSVFGGILVGLLLGHLTHRIAYSETEWQKFTAFFDNRTNLYDYQVIPEYDQHAAFYDGIGLTESEEILLHNYNFGLDEEIDEKMIGEIADYAAANRKEEISFRDQFVEKAKSYYYRMTHGGEYGDFPWNALIIIGYAGLLGFGILRRKTGRMTMLLVLLGGIRTVLWMYILMGDREPARISHSLYYMELCILYALILIESRNSGREKTSASGSILIEEPDYIRKKVDGFLDKSFPVVVGILILLTAGANLPGMISSADSMAVKRGTINRSWQAMIEYCKGHRENFYFIDVYSSVEYSEKMFEKVDNQLGNYDIMGGWACKSPLYNKKLSAFQMQTMEEALLHDENVYIIIDYEYDLPWLKEYDPGIESETNTLMSYLAWLKEYYLDHGVEIEIVQTDDIANKMGVYQIR